MPSDSKVSIKWQIVFSLIYPLNIWAFYRIKKLQRYLLYVFIPIMIISLFLVFFWYYEFFVIDGFRDQMNPPPTLPPHMTPIEPRVGKFSFILYFATSIASSIGFSIFSVYLIIKWSKQWNEKF